MKRWLLLLLLVAGCSEPLKAGTVIMTRVDPAHDEPQYTMVPTNESCQPNNVNVVSCVVSRASPIGSTHYDDRCYITIAGHRDGEVVVEEYQQTCDRKFYDTKVGDYWVRPGYN